MGAGVEEKVVGEVDPEGTARLDGEEEAVLKGEIRDAAVSVRGELSLELQVAIREEGIRGSRSPSDEAACQEGPTCKEVLAPWYEAKTTSARATWEEAGVDTRAGPGGVSGTS